MERKFDFTKYHAKITKPKPTSLRSARAFCFWIYLKSKQAAPIGHTPGNDRNFNQLASVALIHEPGQRCWKSWQGNTNSCSSFSFPSASAVRQRCSAVVLSKMSFGFVMINVQALPEGRGLLGAEGIERRAKRI
jgi:hypothetical protein